MSGPLSIDLRKRMIRLYYKNKRIKRYSDDRNYTKISNQLLVSYSSVWKYVKLFRRTGSYRTRCEEENRTHGRRCKYNHLDLLMLKMIIRKDSTLYLDEIQKKLIGRRRKWFSISVIVRMINKLDITRKRISKTGFHWKYRSVELYDMHLRSLGITKNQLVFADESYCNDRIANRTHGRSVRYAFPCYIHQHIIQQ